VAEREGTASLRDATDGRVVGTLATLPGSQHTVAWTRAGDKLVLAGANGARVFDAGGKLLFDQPTQRAALLDAGFSPDGASLATTSEDGLVRLWDLAGGDLVRVFEGHRDTVMSVSFSRDGERIVTASLDGTAKIWAVASGHLLSNIGHEGAVWRAEFDPEGAHVATAGLDRSAKLWSARTTRFAGVIEAARAPVFAATFSPDGRTLVTSSAARVNRLLDAQSGAELAALPVRSGMSLAAFHPGGGPLAVPDGPVVRLWDAAGGTVVNTLEASRAIPAT
jgi:WD40 repeat protein